MSAYLDNLTYVVSPEQVKALSDIQHRAMVLLGRLRVLNDGSVEVEDDYAADALEALSSRLGLGVSKEAISAIEDRSGMPWSVFVGQCISWWEGYGKGSQGGSTCMPRGLATPTEPESKPRILRSKISQVTSENRSEQLGASALGTLMSEGDGLSLWHPDIAETDDPTPVLLRPRPPVPPIPFLAVLVERIGSLDVFFEGLQWNRGRRVTIRRISPPLWPVLSGALLAIMFSGHLWWAPWPIMSIFGAGAGWLLSQYLGQSRFCSGIACSHEIKSALTHCPRCGGELISSSGRTK